MDPTTQLNIDQPAVNPDPMTGAVQPVEYTGSLQNLVDKMLEKYPETKEEDKPKEEVDKKDERAESEEKPKEDDQAEKDNKDAKSEKESEDEEDIYDASEVDDPEEAELTQLPATPEEYIAKELPLVSTTIMIDGQPKVVQVKIPSQLPPNVEFASKNEELNFVTAMAEQTSRAERLKDQYYSIQQANQVAEFQRAERLEIKEDIAELQKEGLIPKFTRNMAVEDDPKAELAREVLKFYEEENGRRLERSNRQGRPFSRITYRDAFTLYNQLHPKAKPVNKELEKEDKERKDKAKENAAVNKGQGSDASNGERPKLPQTRNLSDLVRYL